MTQTPQKIEWKECKITLTGIKEDGTVVHHEEPGKEAIGTGLGYVIYDLDEDEDPNEVIPYYGIFHIPSGCRIIQDAIVVEELAKRIIIALIPIYDWNRSTDAMIADPLYVDIPKKVIEVYKEVDEKFWKLLEGAHEWEYWGQ
jgi:hypothetical protein